MRLRSAVHKPKIWSKFVIGAMALSMLAACGTSSDTATATSSTSVNAGSAPGSSSAAVAGAEEAVAQAMTSDVALPITRPLDAPPAKGKKIVFLRCDAEVCGIYEEALKAATEAIGWEYTTIPFKNADPATTNAALDEALRLSPAAVFMPGVNPELWASKVQAYVDAGTPLITSATKQIDNPSGLFVDVASTPHLQKNGALLANWVATESGGTGNVMLVSIPELPVFKTMGEEFKAVLPQVCPNCVVQEQNVTYAQFASGEGQAAVVSALRRAPDVNYVVSLSGSLTAGLPAQLQAAGIEDQATLAIAQARELNMTDIVAGTLSAGTSIPIKIFTWLMVDAAVRFDAGEKVDPAPYNDAVDPVLITKENVGTPTETREAPEDYEAQFKKLWLVG